MSTRSGRIAKARSPSKLRRQAIAAAFGGLSALTLVAEAHADTAFAVRHKAPPSCPDRAAFIGDIQRRSRIAKPVGQAEQPDVSLVVEINEKGPSRFHGRLIITEGTASRERTIQGKTCPEVSRALALVAALAIDPLAETNPVEPLPLPPDPSKPGELKTQPALQVGPAPRIDTPPEPPRPGALPPVWDSDLWALPLPPWVVAGPPAPWRTIWGVGASFVLDVGPAPSPLIGGGLTVELTRSRSFDWSIRAGLSAAVTADAPRVRGHASSYRFVEGELAVCAPAFRVEPWLRLAPCGNLDLGGVWSSVEQTSNASAEAVGPWFAAGIAGRLDLIPADSVQLGLEVGPSFPLVHPRFVDEQGAAFYEPPAASFAGRLSLAAEF